MSANSQAKERNPVDEPTYNQYLQDIADGESFDVKETARRLNVSIWAVRGYIRNGVLDALKHGRGYVVPKTALYNYIQRKVKAPAYSLHDKIVPSELTEKQRADYEAQARQEAIGEPEIVDRDPAPEPEPVEPEPAPEPPRRPRPTSFSDGIFG